MTRRRPETQPRLRRGHPRAAASRLLGAFGLALIAFGALAMAARIRGDVRYDQLAREAVDVPQAVVTEPADHQGEVPAEDVSLVVDWDALRDACPSAVAWLHVEGTDIDLPVLEAPEDQHDYYLTHDAWGRPSAAGTPYLDHRSSPQGAHRLVFGHHLGTGGQFSQLQRASDQDRLEELGCCHWVTPARGDEHFRPLCALCVDAWYPAIQRFDFRGADELRSWLREILGWADARHEGSDDLVEGARAVVTLATCSSDLAGQRWRTLVVFVGTEG